MLIRKMECCDIDDVVAIEKDLFASPWDEEALHYEIEKNAFANNYVLEIETQIIGYIGMWLLGDQCQITTIGIKREFQGRGYSKILMAKCEELTKQLGYPNINLEVRISNHKAISLYEKFGFKIVTVRKNYYQDNHEDAYLMLKEMEG